MTAFSQHVFPFLSFKEGQRMEVHVYNDTV
jgi:hypothetical protein